MALKKLKGSNKRTGLCKLGIEGGMTIYQAAEIKAGLNDCEDGYKDIQLDLSTVTEFDCAGLQLIMAIHRDCKHQGRAFCLSQASAPVAEVLQLFHLKDLWSCGSQHGASGAA